MTSNKLEKLLHLVGWFSWKFIPYCFAYFRKIRKSYY